MRSISAGLYCVGSTRIRLYAGLPGDPRLDIGVAAGMAGFNHSGAKRLDDAGHPFGERLLASSPSISRQRQDNLGVIRIFPVRHAESEAAFGKRADRDVRACSGKSIPPSGLLWGIAGKEVAMVRDLWIITVALFAFGIIG